MSLSLNQKTTVGISILALLVAGFSAYYTYKATNISDFGNTIQEQMKGYQKESIDLQNNMAELEKRKLWFDVLTQLGRDIDNVPNSEEMRLKFLNKQKVENQINMSKYINIFEDIYFSCHRGISPKDDIRYSFGHHLAAICGNQQVLSFIGDTHGGLRKLCNIFYPDSLIGKSANMETNNCK